MILLYRFNIIVWLGDIVGAGWGVAPWYGGDGGNANVCRHIGGAKESQWTHYGTEKVGFTMVQWWLDCVRGGSHLHRFGRADGVMVVLCVARVGIAGVGVTGH